MGTEPLAPFLDSETCARRRLRLVVRACGSSCKVRQLMKSVVRASVRVAQVGWVVAVCSVGAFGCVEGDPIPPDVIQRAEQVLLEGNTGVAPAASSSSESVAPGASVAPGGSVAPVGVNPLPPGSGFPAGLNAPVLPEAEEFGDDVIPDNAIPLEEFLAQ